MESGIGELRLQGVLETVAYCTTANEDATRRFYREVLGLRPFNDTSAGHRIGLGVLLLFNRDESSVQDWPPPHGVVGPVHTCFLASPGEYESWKEHVAGHGVEITNETTWDSGVRSFYFDDPAGNVLEIAEADLWPPGDPDPAAVAAADALAVSLRGQMMDRVKAQEQLVVITITLIGVAASFVGLLQAHPELTALVGLLFFSLALLMLRQDDEITVIADYLLSESVFGAHAQAQAGWERHKFEKMQGGGWLRNPGSVAQVIAIYGPPVLAGVGFSVAAIWSSPSNWRTWTIVVVTAALACLFGLGSRKVVRAYGDLGHVRP